MKKYYSNIMAILLMPIIIPSWCMYIMIRAIMAGIIKLLVPTIEEKDIWKINHIYDWLEKFM